MAGLAERAPVDRMFGGETVSEANPDMVALSEDRMAANRRFPVLSEMPGEAPERDSAETLAEQETVLVAEQQRLSALSLADIEKARAERRETVSVIVDGEPIELPLEEAAARVEANAAGDRAAAADQAGQPVPSLGGKPPKDKR